MGEEVGVTFVEVGFEAKLSQPKEAPNEQSRNARSVRGLNKPDWEVSFFLIQS
jgi:hypothetical protein